MEHTIHAIVPADQKLRSYASGYITCFAIDFKDTCIFKTTLDNGEQRQVFIKLIFIVYHSKHPIPKCRFSLLLLEPNEIYFEDFAVSLLPDPASPSKNSRPSSHSPPFDGRLKMCSKSLVFVPRDALHPIVKLAYRDCLDISAWPVSLFDTVGEILAVQCRQQTEMFAANRLAPYEFRTAERLMRFQLHYARVEHHLPMLSQLRRAATLHASEQNDMLATIVFSRNARQQFDPLWLDDFTEPIVQEHTVDEISPLVTNPGRLVLTPISVYFQPFNNVQPVSG